MTSDLISEWCEYHHNLNSISASRRVAQKRILRSLEATLSGPVDKIDGRDLERFMEQMIRDGYHAHSVVSYLKMIRPFVRWMRGQGLIDADRWLRLQEVKGPRGAYDGKPRPYTRQEVRRFWTELDERYPWTRDRDPQHRTPARGEYWVRRWAAGNSGWKRVYPYARRLQLEAIVALALYGGLRRDEVYNLGILNMHYENEYVRVVSHKGAEAHERVRVVPMNEPMSLAIGNWLEFREQVLKPPHEFPWLHLWAGRAGGREHDPLRAMTHTRFAMLLSSVGAGWSFHRLRHTYGTERYRAGMPLEILKETLGHSRITQTLGYTQITEDRIIAASHSSDAAFIESIQRQEATP